MLKLNKKAVEKLVEYLEKTNKTIVYDTCMFIQFPNLLQQTRNKVAISDGVYEDLHRYALQKNQEAPRAFQYMEEHVAKFEQLQSTPAAPRALLRDRIIADLAEAQTRENLLFISKDADIAAILHKKHEIDVLIVLFDDTYSALRAKAYHLPTLDLTEFYKESELEWKKLGGDYIAEENQFVFRLHADPMGGENFFTLQVRRVEESAFHELGYRFSEAHEQFKEEATEYLKVLRYVGTSAI